MRLRSPAVRDCVAVVALGALLLAACATVTGVRRLRAGADNDAVGYTTAARSLAETGHITSHVIYPSVLEQPAKKSVLYMPGFYAALALSYKLFGFGAWQSLLVSWAGYVIAAVCTYLIGLRLYGRRVGLVAAGLFMIYPANLYFAMTAMSELAVTAAGAVAVAIVAWLPARRRVWAAPLLLALPFVFRETTALLAFPMMALAARGGRRPLYRAMGAAGLSILVLAAVFRSPVSSGRPSMLALNVFVGFERHGKAIYCDAVPGRTHHPKVREWVTAVAARARDQVSLLRFRWGREVAPFDLDNFFPIVLAAGLLLLHASMRRDALSLATALTVFATVVFLLTLYTVRSDRPMRLTMFTAPLVATGLAAAWCDARSAIASRFNQGGPWLPLSEGVVTILIVVLGARLAHSGLKAMTRTDAADDEAVRLLEQVSHDDHTVLAAPGDLCLPYAERHFPVTVSFAPMNAPTLRVLCSHVPLTTVVADWGWDTAGLRPADLEAEGFRLDRHITFNGRSMDVFRRQAGTTQMAPTTASATTLPPAGRRAGTRRGARR